MGARLHLKAEDDSSGSNLNSLVPSSALGSPPSRTTRGRKITSPSSRARSSSSSSSDSNRGSPKSSRSRMKLKKEIVYVKTWEERFGQAGDEDDFWVVIDLKLAK